MINADHRDIGLMVVSGTSDDELTRNGIALMERGEPLNIRQWMWVNPEMVWQFEDDVHLRDTHCLQSNIRQHTLNATMTPGTYYHAQKKKILDVLHPTQMPY